VAKEVRAVGVEVLADAMDSSTNLNNFNAHPPRLRTAQQQQQGGGVGVKDHQRCARRRVVPLIQCIVEEEA
jgi:hypothetical protein